MDEGRPLRLDDGRRKSQRAALSAAIGLRFEVGGKKGRDPRLNSLRSIFSIYLTGQAREGPSADKGTQSRRSAVFLQDSMVTLLLAVYRFDVKN